MKNKDYSHMLMGTKRRLLWHVIFLACLLISPRLIAGVDVLLDLKDARLESSPNYTNRTVRIYPMSVPTVSSPSVVLGHFISGSTDTSGQLWISNLVVGLYQVQVMAPPSMEQFKFLITTNDSGWIYAANNLVALSTATFQPGSVAWAAAVSDARYGHLTGTNGQLVIAGTNINILTNGSVIGQSTATISALTDTNIVKSIADAEISANVPTNSQYSAIATNAQFAGYATNAGFALLSTNSLFSSFATNANYSTNSGLASLATEATHATNADLAISALYASNTTVQLASFTNQGSIDTNGFVTIQQTPGGNIPDREPLMGYNSWYANGPDFGWTNNAAGNSTFSVVTFANYLISAGYRDAGYNVFIISEGATSPYRDGSGNILWNTNRYPAGMKIVVDYLHSLGFLVYFYTEDSTNLLDSDGVTYNGSYVGMPLSLISNTLAQLAQLGFDGIDVDDRHNFADSYKTNGFEFYCRTLQSAANTCGRPMSIVTSGVTPQLPWLSSTMTAWDELGMLGNIANTFSNSPAAFIGDNTDWSEILRFFLDTQHPEMIGPGHFIYHESLRFANQTNQYAIQHDRTVLATTVMKAGCLFIGGMPLPSNLPQQTADLKNPLLKMICRDPLVQQGRLFWNSNWAQIWVRPLAEQINGVKSKSVGLFNLATNAPQTISLRVPSIGFGTNAFTVLDVFNNTNIPVVGGSISMSVPTNTMTLLLVRGQDPTPTTVLSLATNSARYALARVPVIGVDSSEMFGSAINESNAVFMIDYVSTNNLTDLGYRYVILSDGWSATNRDSSGNIQLDPDKFPSGISYLVNRAHSYGIGIGLFGSSTTNNPSGRAGFGGGSIVQDMDTLSGWGIDFVDLQVNSITADNVSVVQQVANAIDASGRPMFLRVSYTTDIGPANARYMTFANSYEWRAESSPNFTEFITNRVYGQSGVLDYNQGAARRVDYGNLNWVTSVLNPSTNALRSILTWDAMANAGVIILPICFSPGGFPQLYQVLTNSVIYKLHQDTEGGPAEIVQTNGTALIFKKPIAGASGPAVAMGIINTDINNPTTVAVTWSTLGLPSGSAIGYDLWYHTNGVFINGITNVVQAADAVCWILYPGNSQPNVGTLAQSIPYIQGSAIGSVPWLSSTGWVSIPPGSIGQSLFTGGPNAPPYFTNTSGGLATNVVYTVASTNVGIVTNGFTVQPYVSPGTVTTNLFDTTAWNFLQTLGNSNALWVSASNLSIVASQTSTNQLAIAYSNIFDTVASVNAKTNLLDTITDVNAKTNLLDTIADVNLKTNSLGLAFRQERTDATNQLAIASTNRWQPKIAVGPQDGWFAVYSNGVWLPAINLGMGTNLNGANIQSQTITSNQIALATIPTNRLDANFYAWVAQLTSGGVQTFNQLGGGTATAQTFTLGTSAKLLPTGTGIVVANIVTGTQTNSTTGNATTSTWSTNMSSGATLGLLTESTLPSSVGTRFILTNSYLSFIDYPNSYLQTGVPFTNASTVTASAFFGAGTNNFWESPTLDNPIFSGTANLGTLSIGTANITNMTVLALSLSALDNIPTNLIPSSTSVYTNYVLVNWTNIGPVFVATNIAAAGSFLINKPTLTLSAWP